MREVEPSWVCAVVVCCNDRAPGHPRGCCRAEAGTELRGWLRDRARDQGLKRSLVVHRGGCMDVCGEGVTVAVHGPGAPVRLLVVGPDDREALWEVVRGAATGMVGRVGGVMRKVSPAIAALSGNPYSRFAGRLAAWEGPVYPLHIGDTWMEPAEGCRMEDFTVDANPGMHRYTNVQGHPPLVDALVARDRERSGLPTERAEVLVTLGATGGLAAVVGAIVEPGDEVVILAPHWPLIAGMVRACRAVPVIVPFIGVAQDAASAAEILRAALTPRTVAVYWNTPNNPTGRVIPRAWLEALVEVARAADLWILADEVYEAYVYAGEHTPTRPLAPERTIGLHSFSKAYGMAGNRVGWAVGPSAVMGAATGLATQTVYGAPTAAQLAAREALGPAGDAWITRARAIYAELGRGAAARLGVPEPEGSTFLFVDVADQLDGDGLDGLLARAAERGLLVAPGTTFGPYPTHLRVCFTCAPPDVVRAGIEVLAGLLRRQVPRDLT